MKYNVTLDSYALVASRKLRQSLPPIPGTTRQQVWDTEQGMGKEIWHGYLATREQQKKERNDKPVDIEKVDRDQYAIILDHTASEADKFKEAINLFLLFLAGEGRDNVPQVTAITKIDDGSSNKERFQKEYSKEGYLPNVKISKKRYND